MKQHPVSRKRRAAISVCIIIFCLGMSSYLVVTTNPSALAGDGLKAFMELARLVVMFYIGGSVIDASSGSVSNALASKFKAALDQPDDNTQDDPSPNRQDDPPPNRQDDPPPNRQDYPPPNRQDDHDHKDKN